MFREKQHRASRESDEVNFVRGSGGVIGPSLLKNVDWNVVGMVVCLRRTLPGGWELRSVGDIEIAPLTWHFLLKNHSTLRILPGAHVRWASSFVRGVSKAFKLKLDLETHRKSPASGGKFSKAILIRLYACCLYLMTADSF